MLTLRSLIALFAAMVIVAAALIGPGCAPVAWLPDSSGFVYTGGTNFRKLVFYSVETGKSRELAEVSAHTSWPALSRDGKLIALARLAPSDDRQSITCQLVFYDLTGKLVDRSDVHPWRKPTPGQNETKFDESKAGSAFVAALYWDHATGRLVIQEGAAMGKGHVGIYDPAKKTLTTASGNACPVGGTPFRPDGKGILITRGDPEFRRDFGVLAVDWDGKEHTISMPEGVIRQKEVAYLMHWPWMGNSQWEKTGATAIITSGHHRIKVDAAKLTGGLEKVPDEQALADGKAVLQSFSFGDKAPQVRMTGDKERPSLEMILPGESSWKRIGQLNGLCIFCPSPDGKWLLVRTMTDVMEQDGMLLISATGEVKHITGQRR